MTDEPCATCGHPKARHEEPSEDACGVHRCTCWGYKEPLDEPALRLFACVSCEYTFADQGELDRADVTCPSCTDDEQLLLVDAWPLDEVRDPKEIVELVETAKPWLEGGPGGFLL